MGKTKTNWDVVKMFAHDANRINAKEHFDLKKYHVTLKEVAKVRYGAHCKYNINYHFVWIPKTRMKILVSPFKEDVEKWLLEICKKNSWHPLALEVMPDHIHFFLSAHPKWNPTRIVQLLKQETSKNLRAKYSTIRNTRMKEDFWATGYYVGTAGHVSADQIARYILEQTENLKKDFSVFGIEPFVYDIEKGNQKIRQETLHAFEA